MTSSPGCVFLEAFSLEPEVSLQLDRGVELAGSPSLISRCGPEASLEGRDVSEWEVPLGSGQLCLHKRPAKEDGVGGGCLSAWFCGASDLCCQERTLLTFVVQAGSVSMVVLGKLEINSKKFTVIVL